MQRRPDFRYINQLKMIRAGIPQNMEGVCGGETNSKNYFRILKVRKITNCNVIKNIEKG